MYALLADAVVVLHVAFVAFVLLGGLLVLRWPSAIWLHVPAALWGAAIEFAGWICPLTPLEQWLRRRAGESGYAGGFVEHYVTELLYPAGLTHETQVILGGMALLVNAVVYAVVLARRRRRTL